ncbi:30S ribosome-binding factor RbfA [Tannockella kyphosi]|uniref:30S ribosome-binding factor RbfA n=1 Tax=Tannockella kyphosi TaxID=2899121 RepID=UPI002011E736|nr:30S ribosome-binding factor RbfA [Tannockella kyphosi]
MVLKKDKMNGIIQRELSEIIRLEVSNKEIGFCTITAIDVTTDLSLAKVYVTFLGSGNNEERVDALNRSKGFIRSCLSKRLTIRRVPELKFIFDSSLEYGNKIESIIYDLNEKNK